MTTLSESTMARSRCTTVVSRLSCGSYSTSATSVGSAGRGDTQSRPSPTWGGLTIWGPSARGLAASVESGLPTGAGMGRVVSGAPASGAERRRARHDAAHPGPGREARLDARREPPGGGPPYREPTPGGRWSAVGVAAPRAADRSRRRAVRAAGEPRYDGGAPAPRHGRLAQRRHRSGSAIPAAPGLDHGRGREGVRHRLAVHPRGGDQDSHGRPRAPADQPAAGELRRATAGTPAGRDAGGLDAGGPAHRDPAALQAVRARPAGAETSGAGRRAPGAG